MDKWVLLETFNSEAEARVVESRLQAEGIETQLLGSQSRAAGLIPEMLRLMVQNADENRAQAILKSAE